MNGIPFSQYFQVSLIRVSFQLSSGTAEKLAIKEYSASIGKSKDIMEHYINVLSDQGVTKVDIWQAPTDASNDESEDRENVEDNSPQPKDRSTNLEENKDGKHKVIIFFLSKLKSLHMLYFLDYVYDHIYHLFCVI